MRYNPIVTVCSACRRAACWQGEFMCDDSRGASTVDRRVGTLIRDGGSAFGEHPDYWNRDLHAGHNQLLAVADLRVLGITDPELLDLST